MTDKKAFLSSFVKAMLDRNVGEARKILHSYIHHHSKNLLKESIDGPTGITGTDFDFNVGSDYYNRWMQKVKQLLGVDNLDGKLNINGYSIDDANHHFDAHWNPAEYVDHVKYNMNLLTNGMGIVDYKDLDLSNKTKLGEAAPPDMEDWVKKNKAKFKKEYGEKKGLEVLYATAWKLHDKKMDESEYYNEEEELNEVSKKTLTSYIDKAVDDVAGKARAFTSAKHNMRKIDKESETEKDLEKKKKLKKQSQQTNNRATDYHDKASRRKIGIRKAVKKLTGEGDKKVNESDDDHFVKGLL